MGKRFHWILLVLISALGLGAMIYFGLQPRPETRLELNQYENPAEAGKAAFMELRKEIRQNPFLLLGIEENDPDHWILVQEFLNSNSEPGSAYDLVVVDSGFETSGIPNATRISTREQFEEFVAGTEKALGERKRVVAIVPTVFASQTIVLNLAENYRIRTGRTPMSFSVTGFPRNRTMEKNALYPCIVEGVDQSGLGPFGCMILTIARSNYRKRFTIDKPVAILNQIGSKDFLFLYTIEN